MRTAVLVGNPKPRSRTYDAAVRVATRLTDAGPDLVVDLADLGAELLAFPSTTLDGLVVEIAASELLVVASPRTRRRTPVC